MATTQTQQSDDLLIIDDGSTMNGDDMDFTLSFDEPETPSVASPVLESASSDVISSAITEENTTSSLQENSEISLDFSHLTSESAEKQEVSTETQTSPITDETPSLDLGISFDTPVSDIQETSPEISDNQESTSNAQADISFAEISDTPEQEVMSQTSVETSPETDFTNALSQQTDATQASEMEISSQAGASSSSGDDSTMQDDSMNDILAETILKLEARAQAIAGEKSEKLSQISDLEAKIQALQDEQADHKLEVKNLESESEKITANITKLEEMKLDPVKEHNAKRSVKK